MTVYLLHFEKPLAHAAHYLGFCEDSDVSDRVAKHGKASGSKLLSACNRAGIGFHLALVIPGADRNFERKLKNRGGAGRWCPHCAVNTRPIPQFNPGAPTIIYPATASWAHYRAAA